MTAIGVIAVAARLYARLFITRAAGIDDAIIGVALLLAIGSSVLNVYGAEALYVGYHNWDIPVSDFTRTRLNSWCAQWLYSGALSAVKISLLLFYRRLSGPFSRFFLWATWIGITYNLRKAPLSLNFLIVELIRSPPPQRLETNELISGQNDCLKSYFFSFTVLLV